LEIKFTNSGDTPHVSDEVTSSYCFHGEHQAGALKSGVSYFLASTPQIGAFAIGVGFRHEGIEGLTTTVETLFQNRTIRPDTRDISYAFVTSVQEGMILTRQALPNHPQITVHFVGIPADGKTSITALGDIRKDGSCVYAPQIMISDISAIVISLASPRKNLDVNDEPVTNELLIKHLGLKDYGYAILWDPRYDPKKTAVRRGVTNSSVSDRRHQQVSAHDDARVYERRQRGFIDFLKVTIPIILVATVIKWGEIRDFARSINLNLPDLNPIALIQGAGAQENSIEEGIEFKETETCVISTDGGVGAAVRSQPDLDPTNIIPASGIPDGTTVQILKHDNETIQVPKSVVRGAAANQDGPFYINAATCIR